MLSTHLLSVIQQGSNIGNHLSPAQAELLGNSLFNNGSSRQHGAASSHRTTQCFSTGISGNPAKRSTPYQSVPRTSVPLQGGLHQDLYLAADDMQQDPYTHMGGGHSSLPHHMGGHMGSHMMPQPSDPYHHMYMEPEGQYMQYDRKPSQPWLPGHGGMHASMAPMQEPPALRSQGISGRSRSLPSSRSGRPRSSGGPGRDTVEAEIQQQMLAALAAVAEVEASDRQAAGNGSSRPGSGPGQMRSRAKGDHSCFTAPGCWLLPVS